MHLKQLVYISSKSSKYITFVPLKRSARLPNEKCQFTMSNWLDCFFTFVQICCYQTHSLLLLTVSFIALNRII